MPFLMWDVGAAYRVLFVVFWVRKSVMILIFDADLVFLSWWISIYCILPESTILPIHLTNILLRGCALCMLSTTKCS